MPLNKNILGKVILMVILSSLLWAAVATASVFIVFKWYLPALLAQPQPEDVKMTGVPVTKKLKIVVFVLSIVLSALCGYFSGLRQDEWMSVFRMILAMAVLNVISITDITLYRIPNVCVLILLAGRVLSIIAEMIVGDGTLLLSLLNSLIAGIACLIFLFLASKITGGGIGYGDIKLFAALGFLCGTRAVVYTLLLSVFICSIVSVVLLISKKKKLKDGLPMGPFIWVGFAITVILALC